jgi:hypothetical protein
MPLKGALRGVTEFDVLFALYVGVALLILAAFTYDFAEAWLAPRCSSIRDVGLFAWCLPIGFEGPITDFWSNRSLFNARVATTLNLIVVSLAFVCAVYFVRGEMRSRAIAYFCGVAVILILLIKAFLLNDLS